MPDATDHRLLALLREDGRISMSELAGRLAVSRANAYTRLDRLQRDGVVQGFTARVDHAAVGLPIAALIIVTLEQVRWQALRHALAAMPEVVWCAYTTGEFDAVLLVRAPGMEVLRDVVLTRLHALQGVRATRTIFILDEVVDRPFVLPGDPVR